MIEKKMNQTETVPPTQPKRIFGPYRADAAPAGPKRIFAPHRVVRRLGGTIGRGDFPNAVLQGTTPNFQVYVIPELGAAGLAIARGVLAACERDYNTIQGYFNGIAPDSLPFNVVIGAYGIVCLIVFFWAIGTSGHLQPGEDAVEPIALLAAPFGINALYTFGWLVEVPARLLVPDLTPRFGPLLLRLGMGLGLALISLPAVFWAGFRFLQMIGLAK